MKKIISLLSVILIAAILSVTVFAASLENFSQYQSDLKAIKQDTGETLTQADSYPLYFYDTNSDPALPISERLLKYYSWYKTLAPKGTIIESWSNGGWQVQYYYDIESGKWQEAGSMSQSVFRDKEGNPLPFEFSMEGISSIAASKIQGEITELKLIYLENSYLIYAVTQSNEYIIPYSPRPEFTGIENGKVYGADEAVDTMLKSLGFLSGADVQGAENTPITDPGEYTVGGGSERAPQKSKNLTGLYIIIALVIITVPLILLRFKNKQN